VPQDGRSGCPINRAVEALGDRWTLLVLRDIVFGGRRHFRELLAGSEEGIASNILADRLHRLVDDGMLTRDDPGRGRRATYSLTEASIQLIPVFVALGSWGLRHRETTDELAIRAELLEEGGPAMWEDFMAELRVTHLGAPAPAHPREPVVERLRAAREAARARDAS
jgi:DNA-binding HxlR family transcriptional regulator